MPFKSEKQRRYMHANKPQMAKRWEREGKKGGGKGGKKGSSKSTPRKPPSKGKKG